MGKYMRHQNPKSSPDVALIDASSLDGVRTRAKTLAMKQRLQKPDGAALSYLQLRSRRLEKPPISAKKRPRRCNDRNAPGLKANYKKLGGNDVVEENAAEKEGSFGENCLDFEMRERGTRESTPSSLIRDPEIIRTPGSSTRPTCSAQAQRGAHNPMLSHIPTPHDMDEFFSGAEVHQQQQFIEKYNFDPVNEVPLPGRYEWVKLKPKS